MLSSFSIYLFPDNPSTDRQAETVFSKAETLWELQKSSGRFRNALGASKRLWDTQKRSGSFKKVLGGSETFWELQKSAGRFRNAL